MSIKNHVRLKPYSPAKGQVKRTYNSPWGFTYKAGTWYVEPDDLAEERGAYLATVRMNSCDDFSPKAFNICTRKEAERIKLYEESGELEKVISASEYAVPPAPTDTAPAKTSQDLNLPSPKSELAAAAAGAATKAERESAESEPEVAEKPRSTQRDEANLKSKLKPKPKPKQQTRSRRRRPSS